MYCSKCGAWSPDGETLCGSCGTALPGAPPPHPAPVASAPPPAPRPRYGGFWRRGVAALVDFCVYTPFAYALQYALGRSPFDPPDWDAGYWGVQSILLALSWLYGALMESAGWQGTLGQQLLDLRVSDLGGRRIGFLRATGRHFGQYLSFFTLGIGYLLIVFTARKQALHDLLAGCVLVRREPAPESAAPPVPVAPAAPTSLPGLGA